MAQINFVGFVLYQQPSFWQARGCPTQRAADGGYVPRFLGIFVALGFLRFEGESTLPPTAANAPR
jgi:hypothetical protein